MKKFPIYLYHGGCQCKVLNDSEFIEVDNDILVQSVARKTNEQLASIIITDGTSILESTFEENLKDVLGSVTNLPSIEAVTNQR